MKKKDRQKRIQKLVKSQRKKGKGSSTIIGSRVPVKGDLSSVKPPEESGNPLLINTPTSQVRPIKPVVVPLQNKVRVKPIISGNQSNGSKKPSVSANKLVVKLPKNKKDA